MNPRLAAQADQDRVDREVAAAAASNPLILRMRRGAHPAPIAQEVPIGDVVATVVDADDRRVVNRAPGTVGSVFGPEGQVWPARRDPEAAQPAEPVEPLEELPVAKDARFSTSEGRLLAEGWNPPPDIRAVLDSREALRSAWRRIGTRAVNDAGAIHDAIRRADVDSIITALVANAVDAYLSSIEGSPDHAVQMASAQLEEAWRRLAFHHRDSLLATLAGRQSPAAERLRRGLEALSHLQAPPKVTFFDYQIRR